MITLARLLHLYASDLVAHYGNRMRPEHHRALWALKACHTEQCGKLHYQCPDCPQQRDRYGSCGHRFCPACQQHHNQQWLQRQQHKLLPCNYYLVTFTLPATLRGVCRSHQKACYQALFQAASQTLQQFAQNDRKLGGQLGMTAVLHTHSRQLNYHPHVHVVVPGGTLNAHLWKAKNCRYLFNGKALAKVFRAKFLAALKPLKISLPPGITPEWVVQCESVGQGDKALIYLSRYLYRGVVNEKNILSLKEGQVSFRYQENASKRWQVITLPVLSFLWRVLQHVLPTGFRRARDYGLLHPSAHESLNRIRLQCRILASPITRLPTCIQPFCRCCGQAMRLTGMKRPVLRWQQEITGST